MYLYNSKRIQFIRTSHHPTPTERLFILYRSSFLDPFSVCTVLFLDTFLFVLFFHVYVQIILQDVRYHPNLNVLISFYLDTNQANLIVYRQCKQPLGI